MTRSSRRSLLAALGLASLTALSGCAETREAIFLLFVLYSFAIVAGFASLLGTTIAVIQIALRWRRSFVNVVLALPFAFAAVYLHAWATKGFTRVDELTFAHATGWLPGSPTSFSHLTMRALLALVGAPLIWLATAVVAAALAPPRIALRPLGSPPAGAPLFAVEKVMTVVTPAALLGAYTWLLLFPRPPEQPISTPPPTSAVADRTAASAVAAPPGPAARSPFELLWTASLGEWNCQVSFAPTGEVLAMSNFTLAMLDAATGKVIKEVPACFSADAGGFGWLDERHAALVCDHEIRGYELPSLRATTLVRRTTHSVAAGAVHPALLVASDVDESMAKKARVRLFDPRTRARLAELPIPADEVAAVAIAPDGVLFALGFDGKIELREAPSGRVVREIPSAGRPHGLSFSPDGKLFFAYVQNFTATVFEVASMRPIRSYRVGSWFTQSAWLPGGTIVATGSDGLVAFFPDGTQASATRITAEGLAVSADGTRVCAGDRRGNVRMFRFEQRGGASL